VVTFDNLNPVIYFVDVWHATHNNYNLAAEDAGWIMTGQLYRNTVNEFIAYVDFIGTTSRKEGKKMAQYKVLKMEPRVKKIRTISHIRYCSDMSVTAIRLQSKRPVQAGLFVFTIFCQLFVLIYIFALRIFS